MLWPNDVKSQFIGKDPDARKDWRQEDKGMAEDEMVGWYHRLNEHEFEQTPGDSEGQGSRACCSHGVTESHDWATEQQPISLLPPATGNYQCVLRICESICYLFHIREIIQCLSLFGLFHWALCPSGLYKEFLPSRLYLCIWPCWVFVAAHRLSLVAASGRLLFAVVWRLLIAVASLVAEHWL